MNHWHTVAEVQRELDQIRLEMYQAEINEREKVRTEMLNLMRHEFPAGIYRTGRRAPRYTFIERQQRLAQKIVNRRTPRN